jgi:hypothetical protein
MNKFWEQHLMVQLAKKERTNQLNSKFDKTYENMSFDKTNETTYYRNHKSFK